MNLNFKLEYTRRSWLRHKVRFFVGPLLLSLLYSISGWKLNEQCILLIQIDFESYFNHGFFWFVCLAAKEKSKNVRETKSTDAHNQLNVDQRSCIFAVHLILFVSILYVYFHSLWTLHWTLARDAVFEIHSCLKFEFSRNVE